MSTGGEDPALPKVKICICVVLLSLVVFLFWSALADGGWQMIRERLSSQPPKH
ncbi:MAG: hypothetical protein RL095_3824 [Verrucomicrobiota bacterium]|jgi:hypothetical protein